MSDGAQQGIGAKRALDTILGGEPAPTKEEGMSREEMERAIMAVSTPPADYNDMALFTAKFILTTLRAHPEIARAPVDTVYDWDHVVEGHPTIARKGWVELFEEMDPAGYNAAVEGITGFMWGWACNAARYVLDLPEVPNPAIITIGE